LQVEEALFAEEVQELDVGLAPDAGLGPVAAASPAGAAGGVALRYAAGEGRVIVTRDADFLRLDATGAVHLGMVYWRPEGRPLGELIRLLVLIWELLDAGEMRGQVEYF
jgi:hypothetical protein